MATKQRDRGLFGQAVHSAGDQTIVRIMKLALRLPPRSASARWRSVAECDGPVDETPARNDAHAGAWASRAECRRSGSAES